MEFQQWLLAALSTVTSVLLLVIGFFLKRLFSQITENHKEIVEFKGSFESRIYGLEKDIINAFHVVCHERQASCQAVGEVKFGVLKQANAIVENKLEKLKLERESDWKDQRKVNGTLFKRLGKKGGSDA